MSTPLRILLVEDSEDDAAFIVRALDQAGFEVHAHRVDTPEDLEAALDGDSWDAIVADYNLPRFTALDALALVKARGLDLPFLIVSGSIGEELAVAAMKAGAHDYVMKGNLARFVPALRREMAEAAVRRERLLMVETIQHDAMHDALTELPNRALFLDRIGLSLARAAVDDDCRFGVLIVGVDRFDPIVGGLGHADADALLISFARRLAACVRPSDTVARIAGDEFGILLADMPTPGAPMHVSGRIQEELKRPFVQGGREIFLTASIGIVLTGSGHERPSDVLRDASVAMQRARRRGPGRREVFDRGMHARAVSLLRLETDLRRATERGELRLHYQPIVCLTTGLISGFEALVRWQHPERGLLGPDEFISVAEETGIIVEIGKWVLGEACRQAMAWNAARDRALSIGVNLSAVQFGDAGLASEVASVLGDTGLDPGLLHIEITESVLMADADAAGEVLLQLKALGVRLHVDDFGTGYSSLSYLHRFAIDTLKVDRSFVARMGNADNGREMIGAIVALAHAMGLDVVAEGVETGDQRAQLAALACEHGQGMFFSAPLEAGAAEALMASGPRW